jgi:hypothetical protein
MQDQGQTGGIQGLASHIPAFLISSIPHSAFRISSSSLGFEPGRRLICSARVSTRREEDKMPQGGAHVEEYTKQAADSAVWQPSTTMPGNRRCPTFSWRYTGISKRQKKPLNSIARHDLEHQGSIIL